MQLDFLSVTCGNQVTDCIVLDILFDISNLYVITEKWGWPHGLHKIEVLKLTSKMLFLFGFIPKVA